MQALIKPSDEEIRQYTQGITAHFAPEAAKRNVMPIFLTRSNYDITLQALKTATQGKPKILVFSSSRDVETFPAFAQDAGKLGRTVAHTNGVYLYGNGNAGMMGEAASNFIEEREKLEGDAHHIVGIGTSNFKAVEEDYPGVVVFIARDLDLRERLMIDAMDAIVVLRGGIGTDAEEAKFLSQDGYIHKTGRPLIYQNTEYDNPRTGLRKAFDFRRGHLQEGLDLTMTTPNHLKNVYFSDTPEATVAFLLDRVEGLQWQSNAIAKPALVDGTGIETLDFSLIEQ